MTFPMVLYLFVLFLFAIFSYGFIDLNLHLSDSQIFVTLQKPLELLVFQKRPIAAGIFLFFLLVFFLLYIRFLRRENMMFMTWKKAVLFLVLVSGVLICSFPAFTYDIFNYITTAKVLFIHHENPYIVMPVEIPNEPYLVFTRAANKVALYGPIWLLLTWAPFTAGMGNIWQTIVAFKLLNVLWYIGFCYLVWRTTKNLKNVLFFALNPLVLIEVLVSVHNDLIMMTLACVGILLWQKKEWTNRFFGLFVFILSVFIKGATVVLIPLLFFRQLTKERLMFIASGLMFILFVVATPIREELYPWYAVWFISTAAFLPYPKYILLWQFCIALSFGLELRHIPYIVMGYYEGPGPIIRSILTVFPAAVWGVYTLIKFRMNSRYKKGN